MLKCATKGKVVGFAYHRFPGEKQRRTVYRKCDLFALRKIRKGGIYRFKVNGHREPWVNADRCDLPCKTCERNDRLNRSSDVDQVAVLGLAEGHKPQKGNYDSESVSH
jgi:hypothetical protein